MHYMTGPSSSLVLMEVKYDKTRKNYKDVGLTTQRLMGVATSLYDAEQKWYNTCLDYYNTSEKSVSVESRQRALNFTMH